MITSLLFYVRPIELPSPMMMLLAFALALLASVASAEIVEHSFHVQNLTMNRLCKEQEINTVNGSFPGPTIQVCEGDTLIIHVFNKCPYNLTIHWHGIFQLHSQWADGPEYVTQCPILPGNNYTYKFTITGQEGTLWWHAHAQWLRATVHGALIIRPRKGYSYPFPKPFEEFPILLGEWWNSNIIEIEEEALADGHGPNISDAFTINGWPGDLYNCSSTGTYKLKVVQGETYLLRLINVALNNELFFKIADHAMTVVAIDACYTNPMVAKTIVIATGQTIDVLLTADQPIASYYMAAHSYDSLGMQFDKTTTRGVIEYENATSSTALMPSMPAFNDTPTAYQFFSSLTSLVNGPHWAPVPLKVDEHMFVTEGLGLVPCGANNSCGAPLGMQFAASMNNQSFELPTNISMLEAFYYNQTSGIFTTDFPKYPPVVFDYTNTNNTMNPDLMMTGRSTRITKLKFNSTVEMVFQNTVLVGKQSHPMHLHGFNFYVLAQGFGNYDPVVGPTLFNLVNPQIRNTVGVPVGGWTVIRFTANNPGIWIMHCHFDTHLTWGLATAFLVENGPTPSTSLPPPPLDLPMCSLYANPRKIGDNTTTAFAWFGSWPAFLVPCSIVFVLFSHTMCKAQHSHGLKFWHQQK